MKLILLCLAAGQLYAAVPYPIVGTGQSACYDNAQVIAAPRPGQPFEGQDAQHPGPRASYTVSADGLTVADLVTGLTWQRGPETNGDGVLDSRDKLTWSQAQAFPAKLNAQRYGGYADWRLPSIKELYSLFDARGIDPSGPMAAAETPFIDTHTFHFVYGDPKAGERIIDAQYATSTLYKGRSVRDAGKLFGVNFADGRIKGYDLLGPRGGEKTFFVQCVRGNPAYGKNAFRDNGNGTVSDLATGLTWTKADSGRGMDWQSALAWVRQQNAAHYLGFSDWRLPNIKELQSILDYSRAPDATQSAAIDPVFQCTAINNERGERDFPFFWSSTTHVQPRGGNAAMYLAFGRASGWMQPPGQPGPSGPPGPREGGGYALVDIHGAGAQRSDPKAGDPAAFPHGRGPQGDVIRIANFVRLVRGGL